ncbi:hypothetical protein BKA93DRAFT_785103 [Sparassis latifolia]
MWFATDLITLTPDQRGREYEDHLPGIELRCYSGRARYSDSSEMMSIGVSSTRERTSFVSEATATIHKWREAGEIRRRAHEEHARGDCLQWGRLNETGTRGRIQMSPVSRIASEIRSPVFFSANAIEVCVGQSVLRPTMICDINIWKKNNTYIVLCSSRRPERPVAMSQIM